IGYRYAVYLQEALIDASADAGDAGHLIAGVEQVLVDRRDRTEAARIRIRRVQDVQFLLPHAVHTQRLSVGASWQPVVEDPRAVADHRLAGRRRRPGDAEARPDRGGAADVRLRFIAH